MGDDLFAGGTFRIAGTTTALNVARWNGSGWSALGNGIDASGTVHALCPVGRDLYCGGFFSSAGSSVVNSITKWDGISWSILGNGVTNHGSKGEVISLTSNGTELFAGGVFTTAGDKASQNIALWHIPHALDIARAGEQLVLSWPATGSNFVLEASSGMGRSNWVEVAQTPVRVGDQLVVTNQTSYANEFYRLRRR